MISPIPPTDTKKPKYQVISADLAKAILNGQLVPGNKLPPRRVLRRRTRRASASTSRLRSPDCAAACRPFARY